MPDPKKRQRPIKDDHDHDADNNDNNDDHRYASAPENMTPYGSAFSSELLPRTTMCSSGMPPRTALQAIRDELALDGCPALNLASFVSTWMEPEADTLFLENISKNFADAEEYPVSIDIQNRCVQIIANLFHAPNHATNSDTNPNRAVGVATVGSSEAIILSCLAAKRLWRNDRTSKGLSTNNPNIVLASNVQVCWEKAARYLELEARYVPCDNEHWHLNTAAAAKLVDQNTVLVAVILGSTYTGHYEDVAEMNRLLEQYEHETKRFVPIHVDAASGGFVAPFAAPDLVWDFRLPHVVSINASGHKYGLCYPGVGWAVWREKKYLPDELVFHINYLGGDQASFTLNFSKGAANVIMQYYVFVRMGKNGFKDLYKNLYSTAEYLATKLEDLGFEILSARDPSKGIPLVAARLRPDPYRLYNEKDIVHVLREYGWIVPSYTMAPNLEHVTILRVVVREDLSRDRCNLLIKDVELAINFLRDHDKDQLEFRRNAPHNTSRLGRIINSKILGKPISTNGPIHYSMEVSGGAKQNGQQSKSEDTRTHGAVC